ncbi:MAG: hypothetical protein OSB26_06990 [Woeseiaceae bacterium]|jgi:hypothetical protein|nr:hypothetical protein [Woeseiaceae bacterium]
MNKIIFLIATLFLCACSTDSEDEASSSTTVGAEIADDYNNAVDKARAVEDQVMDQKRKLDEAVDDTE